MTARAAQIPATSGRTALQLTVPVGLQDQLGNTIPIWYYIHILVPPAGFFCRPLNRTGEMQ